MPSGSTSKIRKWLDKVRGNAKEPKSPLRTQNGANVSRHEDSGISSSREKLGSSRCAEQNSNELDLSLTSGSDLVDEIKSSKDIDILLLRSCDLDHFDQEIFGCVDLRVLDLSENSIASLPPGIASLLCLEDLDLAKNQLAFVPETIKCCRRLSKLNLNYNPLNVFPVCLSEIFALTELSLNGCGLTTLPPCISMLCQLRTLELRENALESLPCSIGRLMKLNLLDAGGNNLSALPDTIVNIGGSLKILKLDWNQLMALPNDFCEFFNLEYLDLTGNYLYSVGENDLGRLRYLTHLLVSENQLKELPDTFDPYSQLEVIRLDSNNLTSLPSTLYRLPIRELSIRNNQLVGLGKEICFLKKLTSLFADFNYLQTIPSEIYMCRKLRVCSLRSNQIQCLPNALGSLPHLNVVDLRGNQISHLPRSFKDHPSLRAVWLKDNQKTPKVPFVAEIDEFTGKEKLTCYYLLPQSTSRKEELYPQPTSGPAVSGARLYAADRIHRLKAMQRIKARRKDGRNSPSSQPDFIYLLPSSPLSRDNVRPIRPYAMMDLRTLQAQTLAEQRSSSGIIRENEESGCDPDFDDYEFIYPLKDQNLRKNSNLTPQKRLGGSVRRSLPPLWIADSSRNSFQQSSSRENSRNLLSQRNGPSSFTASSSAVNKGVGNRRWYKET